MATPSVRGSAIAVRPRNLELSIARSEADPSKHETRHQLLPADVLFWLSVFAILLQFFLTSNVLRAVGIDVNMRVHPASVLVLLCATFALLKGVVPFHQRCRNSPRLLLFVFGVPLLAAYTVYFNGINGAAFYFDSFWSAALLALLLESATDKQKRWLARLLMTLVIANVLIGLWESVTQNNWFPFVADPIDGTSDSAALETEDFRANAFYGHPLGASLITSMAFFLLYSMRIRIAVAGPVIGLLLIGLLAFGGRTALGITGLFSIITAIYVLTKGIIRRNLRLDFVMGITTVRLKAE
jgi:hypothetical protein